MDLWLTKYVERQDGKRVRCLGQLDRQLEALRKEVNMVKPSIRVNIRETVNQQQDAIVVRYSELSDKDKLILDIQNMFADSSLLNVLVDTAIERVIAIASSQELQETVGWQERTVIKPVGNKVYRLEAHYKVKILEDNSKGNKFSRSKETTVLIAYKFIVHTMDLHPKDFSGGKRLQEGHILNSCKASQALVDNAINV